MKVIILLMISCFLLSCATPDYLPKKRKIGEIEYFDIETFNKVKNPKTNSYYLHKKDTIEILNSIKSDYSFETFGVYKKRYKLIKEYYLNGMIKERGKEFFTPNSINFKIGKWEYFDEQGNLLRVEDKDGKDRDYPMTYREAFRRVCWRYGFSLKDVDILIIPTDEGVFWFFDKGEDKQMIVNMKTGKVKKIQMEYKE